MGSVFKSPKPPKPVDPVAVGAQQADQNTANAYEQTGFNRPNQTNQFGSTSNWFQSGTDERGNPIFGQSTQFGDLGNQYSSGLSGLGSQYFTGAQNFLGNRPDLSGSAAFDQANQLWSSINDPRLQRERDALDNRLKNQGFSMGDKGYQDAMGDQNLQQEAARQQFQLGAQGQMFNQAQQGRQNEVSEFAGLTQPGLAFGNNVLNTGFASVPGVSVGNVDYPSLYNSQYNQQAANYQAKLNQQNAMLGGLAGIGGAAMLGPFGGYLGQNLFGGQPSGYSASGNPIV